MSLILKKSLVSKQRKDYTPVSAYIILTYIDRFNIQNREKRHIGARLHQQPEP